MKKQILITGAAGTIGRVLMKCLRAKYEVIGIDKKASSKVRKLDILKQSEKFKKLLKDTDVIIYLAWDTRWGIDQSKNKRMTKIVLKSAAASKVKRVILASSVHVAFGHINYSKTAKNHLFFHPKRKVKIADGPSPISSYGRAKVYLESLGKKYSKKGIEVIAVRFGNVTRDNSYGEYPFWLSWKDLCQFIKKCCLVKKLPKFSILFAISNNSCNPFDICDARGYLGYKPQDSASCPYNYKII